MDKDAMFFGDKTDPATQPITEPMHVLEKGVYRGPHYYSHTPMIRIMLDLGRMEEWPSNRIPGFVDRLIETLPGLERHGCSLKRRGGFVTRLRDGTWLGHIAEHVALELQSMTGPRVTRGKTRSVKGRPGVYNVMFAYLDDQVGLLAGRIAIELINSLLPEELQGVKGLDRIYEAHGPFDFEERLDLLRRLVRRRDYGPTTQSLVDEGPAPRNPGDAPQRRKPRPAWPRPLPAADPRKHQRQDLATGRRCAGDKNFTKQLLADSGIPVPRGVVVRNVEDAVREARRLRYPLVTKPLDGNHGRGVTIGIKDEEQLRFGFAEALREAKGGRRIIVEEYFEGNDHRVLVVEGKGRCRSLSGSPPMWSATAYRRSPSSWRK
jgi:cyanophycin synthetase